MIGKQPRETRDGYQLINGAIDPTDIQIDDESVNALYGYLMQDFLPTLAEQLPGKHSLRDHDRVPGSVAIGNSMNRIPGTDLNLRIGGFTGLKLTHDDSDSWRLRVWDTRYRHNGKQNKIIGSYFIYVASGTTTRALREARFIRDDRNPLTSPADPSPLARYNETTSRDELFDRIYDTLKDGDAAHEPTRLMYERPLQSADCLRLQDKLTRVVGRTMVLGSQLAS